MSAAYSFSFGGEVNGTFCIPGTFNPAGDNAASDNPTDDNPTDDVSTSHVPAGDNAAGYFLARDASGRHNALERSRADLR